METGGWLPKLYLRNAAIYHGGFGRYLQGLQYNFKQYSGSEFELQEVMTRTRGECAGHAELFVTASRRFMR
jgi:hypothetical protein